MIPIDHAPYGDAAKHGLRPDHDRWRTARVIWHERRRDHAAVLALTDSYSYPYWHLHLLLKRTAREWCPVQPPSSSQWIAYDPEAALGVGMQFNESVCEGGQRVRFRYGAREGHGEVSEGHLCIVRWNVERAELADPLHFVAVKMGKRWVPCVTSEVPATAIQFADAYLHLGKNDAHHAWADSALRDKLEWDYRLKLVLAVLQRARLPEHMDALGHIGAGPLEDMISDWLLDHLEAYLPFDDRFRCALSQVRMDCEPDALQERLKRMLTA